MRSKLNTLKMVADRLPDGTAHKSTSGQQMGHPTLQELNLQ